MQSPSIEEQEALQFLTEYQDARSSPSQLAKYTKIRDETTSQVLPFMLWGWQAELLEIMQQKKYLIILKGRQLGISWVAALLGEWTANFFPTSNVLLLSKGELEAKQLLDKVWFLHVNLPAHLRAHVLKHNDSVIQFGFDQDPETGEYRQTSKITALPATEDAGRGETGTLVICDEWAYHPNAEKNFVAIQPTIDAGNARFIAISTANGSGNFFATNYKLSQRGENNFYKVFLPYYLRPGRNDQWYETKKIDLKATPMLLHQEYPRNEEEAFVASGGCIFDLTALRELEKGTRASDPPDLYWWNERLQSFMAQGLSLWKPFVPTHTYVQWLDTAGTTHGGDFSCYQLWDVTAREQVAEWQGKRDEDWMAELSYVVGQAYGWAFYGVEKSSTGIAVIGIVLNQLGYPRDRFYHHLDATQRQADQTKSKSPGWPPSRTGNAMQQTLGKLAVSNRSITIKSAALIQEMKTFVEDPETHKVEAKPPDHDDRVDTLLGCLYLMELPEASRSGKKPPMPVQPEPRIRRGHGRRVVAA